jgi:hypothetical protein
MAQRVHFECVDLRADLHRPHNEGRVRAVIYRHPDDAPYTLRLAAITGLPTQREPGAPNQPAAPPTWATHT